MAGLDSRTARSLDTASHEDEPSGPEGCGTQHCDCAFDSVHENTVVTVPMPLRLRRGGTLARTLYNKALSDQRLRQLDKREWYAVRMDAWTPESTRRSFLALGFDDHAAAFVAESEAKSESVLTQLWHSLLKLLLGWFVTQTSLNGFLGRGSMFVFSTPQFGRLLGDRARGRLLDIGAGDGAVTAQMAPFFDEVAVTEVSPSMRKILARKNFSVLEIDDWCDRGPWDVISCLNVLDRCAKPNNLLKDIHRSLTPDGRAVIALVIPYQPYVEVGGKGNHEPEERLSIEGTSFSKQVSSVITQVLTPAGFQVEKWTRLPYLCEGDLQQAYYWLSDAVFIVKKDEQAVS